MSAWMWAVGIAVIVFILFIVIYAIVGSALGVFWMLSGGGDDD